MIASTGPGEVRYFQRAIGIHSGAPTRIGLYRCAPSGDPRGDEAFDPFARAWVPTTELRSGRIAPQERVVEVAEYDARQFLLRTLTDGAADALLSSPFRAPGPGAPPTPGAEPDGMRTVRASGQYVLFDGAEYESAHRFGGGVYPSDVTLSLYSSAMGEKFGIAPSQVEGMANVRTHALHAGHWFVLGHLVTGEARVRGRSHSARRRSPRDCSSRATAGRRFSTCPAHVASTTVPASRRTRSFSTCRSPRSTTSPRNAS